MKTVIAIDGPAASGKSSVARELADRLGIATVNSGAFYRALTWWILHEGADPAALPEVSGVLARTRLESGIEGTAAKLQINGLDPTSHLHSEAVNREVSTVSRAPIVRETLMTHLRRLATDHHLVMEGRDIGSAVFPETPYKFYIDASPEVRAQRRRSQGQKDEIATRDRLDASRTNAPLTIAKDACVIDSTQLSVAEVVGSVMDRLSIQGMPIPLP